MPSFFLVRVRYFDLVVWIPFDYFHIKKVFFQELFNFIRPYFSYYQEILWEKKNQFLLQHHPYIFKVNKRSSIILIMIITTRALNNFFFFLTWKNNSHVTFDHSVTIFFGKMRIICFNTFFFLIQMANRKFESKKW